MSPKRPSIRRGFLWTFAGNGFYSLSQWILLVLLARLTDTASVGQFSLTLAITAPIFLATGMNLRVVQASDASRAYELKDYLALRTLTSGAATILSVVAGFIVGLERETLLALCAICAAKYVEAMSQVYYGFFQQNERHELVSQSMLARSICGPTLFAAGLLVTDGLYGAGLGLLIGWAIPQVLLDRRRAKRLHDQVRDTFHGMRPIYWPTLWKLAKKSAPLGIDQGVSSLCINIPRYAIQIVMGSARLGVFASLSYLAQAISTVTSSLGIVVVPRLAKYFHEGARRAFVILLAQMAGVSLLISALGVIFAALLGDWFIGLVLGSEYQNRGLLIALMISSALTTLQRCMGRGLAAAQCFTKYLVVDIITTVFVLLGAVTLIPSFGLIGAAWALSGGFLLGTIAATLLVADMIRAMPNSSPGDA